MTRSARMAVQAGTLLAALLPGAQLRAETLRESGYLLGCAAVDAGGTCTIAAAGFVLSASPAGSTPAAIAVLNGLAPLAAVDIEGDILSMGDTTADLALRQATPRPNDLLEDTLRSLQGNWRPEGEETPFHIRIDGLDWTEVVQDEPGSAYLITPGTTCANGVEAGGVTLSLYPYGGAPDEAACWAVVYLDDTTLETRDMTGATGVVTWRRAGD